MNIFIQKFQKNDLILLAAETKLHEPIDYDCQFIAARDRSGKVVGVAGFNLNEQKYPVFKHIIIAPEYQKKSLGYRLMKKMEDYLEAAKIPCFISYILNVNKRMIDYAKKYGMAPFEKDFHGEWYFKKVGENQIV